MSTPMLEARVDQRAHARARFPWQRARAAMLPSLPLAVAAVAAVWQCVLSLDCDVSWLLTVAERFLDGKRVYVDIVEVNPPASFLIYVPALATGRFTGLSAEFTTGCFVFLLCGTSIVVSGRILSAMRPPPDGMQSSLLGASAVFAFLLMPVACFAQREHIALLTLLPILATLSVEAAGGSVERRMALLAGLGAGVAMAIKPHFAFAVFLPLAYRWWARRSVTLALALALVTAGVVVAAYAASIVLFFPVFLRDVMPLLTAVYLPVRDGVPALLLQPASTLFLVFAGLCAWQVWRIRVSSLALVSILAGAGFFAAMLIQGKGYLNHLYPAVALGAFAVAATFCSSAPAPGGTRRRVVAGGFAATAFAALVIFGKVSGYPGLLEKVAQVAPAHPRLIAVASNLDVGHALTRQIGGEWIGRRCSLWVTGNAAALGPALANDPAGLAVVRRYADADARIFAEDVWVGRPDIVLVDEANGKDWIAAHPAVATALQNYRAAASAAGIAIWRRMPARAHDPGAPSATTMVRG